MTTIRKATIKIEDLKVGDKFRSNDVLFEVITLPTKGFRVNSLKVGMPNDAPRLIAARNVSRFSSRGMTPGSVYTFVFDWLDNITIELEA